MSVDGEEVVLNSHYGSIFTMTDYTSDVANLYLNLSFQTSPKLRLFGMFDYNMSSGEMDEVMMPDPAAILDGDLSHQDFTFTEMNTYSDLDYSWLRANLGLEYKLGPATTLSAEVDYLDLTDDSGGWVYGDETGSLLLLRTGVKFEF